MNDQSIAESIKNLDAAFKDLEDRVKAAEARLAVALNERNAFEASLRVVEAERDALKAEIAALDPDCAGLPTTAGEGYRFIQKGELLQPGDEFYWRNPIFGGPDGWVPIYPRTDWSKPYDGSGAFRRKVEQPQPKAQGYIMLNQGDKIEKGDEVCRTDGEWRPTVCYGELMERSDVGLYRRKQFSDVQYRYLQAGEYVRPGDEMATFEGWRTVGAGDHDGAPVSVASGAQQRYRRKL